MAPRSTKAIQLKLAKGLLDLIVLQLLEQKPMHGYRIISSIRKTFGVYFGPSTIYPLLGSLEEKGFVESEWEMCSQRPRKVYSLTGEGRDLLKSTEDSFNIICKRMGVSGKSSTIPLGDNAISVLTRKSHAQLCAQ